MTNQLVVETLDDLDEYDGMSVVEIAHSITLWPEGSEDQRRAIAAIARRAPGLGHNRPPLAEAIDEELAGFRQQQAELITVAKSAVIIDEPSAQKVLDLAVKFQDLEKRLEEWHDKRKQPFLDGGRLIDGAFNAVVNPLRFAREGEGRRNPGGLRLMLTQWQDKKDAEAEAARQAALAEQRRREQEAEAAQRRLAEAAAAGANQIDAQQQLERAQKEAERAQQRAEAVRPEPIRSHGGTVGRSREVAMQIVDVHKALGWLLRQAGGKDAATQFVLTWLGRFVRAAGGVDAVARGAIKVDGVELSVKAGAASIRR
jgi:hypothetical protein